MKDILRLARCNENELTSFLPTLNDYTLIFTKDTHSLYTKIGENRIFLGTGSTLTSIDQPILKDFRVFADNRNSVPLQAGRFYGLAGNADKTYRMTYANIYDGEMLGILETTVPNDGKYMLDLMTNLNVFTEDEAGIKLWDPVYIGKFQGNTLAVTDKTKLEEVYGIGGVVTEVTANPKIGRFTYSAFLLQATYFTNSIVDMDAVRALITTMLADYVKHDEFDEEMTAIHQDIQDGLRSLGAKVDKNTSDIAALDGRFENYYDKNEINVKLSEKVNINAVYNKAEMDAKLLKKADTANTYTKHEVDHILETAGDKVLSNATGWLEYNQQLHRYIIEPTPDQFVAFVDNDGSDVQVRVSNDGTKITMDATKLGVTLDQVKDEIKKEMDPQLALKADKATTYTKSDVDTRLALKADLTKVEEVESKIDAKADKTSVYAKTETYNRTEIDSKVLQFPTQGLGDGTYGFNKDKTPVKIVPKNVVSVTAIPSASKKIVVSTSDKEAFEEAEHWNISNTLLSNTSATIVATAGGESRGEGNMQLGAMSSDANFGVGAVKSGNVNSVVFKEGKLLHSIGAAGSPQQYEILNSNTAYNKSETYSKEEVDAKIVAGALPDLSVAGESLAAFTRNKTPKKITPIELNPQLKSEEANEGSRILVTDEATGTKWNRSSHWKLNETLIENETGSLMLNGGTGHTLIVGKNKDDSKDVEGIGVVATGGTNTNKITFTDDRIYKTTGRQNYSKTRNEILTEDIVGGWIKKDDKNRFVLKATGQQFLNDIFSDQGTVTASIDNRGKVKFDATAKPPGGGTILPSPWSATSSRLRNDGANIILKGGDAGLNKQLTAGWLGVTGSENFHGIGIESSNDTANVSGNRIAFQGEDLIHLTGTASYLDKKLILTERNTQGWIKKASDGKNFYIKATATEFMHDLIDTNKSNINIHEEDGKIVFQSTGGSEGGDIPRPPQEEGIFGVNKDKVYKKIVPKNLITTLDAEVPTNGHMVVMDPEGNNWYKSTNIKINTEAIGIDDVKIKFGSDGKLYHQTATGDSPIISGEGNILPSPWIVSSTELSNHDANITLNGGKDYNLSLGYISNHSNAEYCGIGLRQKTGSPEVNQISFSGNDKLVHITGANGSTVMADILTQNNTKGWISKGADGRYDVKATADQFITDLYDDTGNVKLSVNNGKVKFDAVGGGGGGSITPPTEDGIYAMDKNSNWKRITPTNVEYTEYGSSESKLAGIDKENANDKFTYYDDWAINNNRLANEKEDSSIQLGKITIGNTDKANNIKGLYIENEGGITVKDGKANVVATDGSSKELLTEEHSIKSLKLKEDDKRVLQIVTGDDKTLSLDLSEAVAWYLGKGGVRGAAQLHKTSWDNYTVKADLKKDVLIPLDISAANFKKFESGRVQLMKENKSSIIRIQDEFVTGSIYFETQGRWKPFTTQVQTGDGKLGPRIVVYQRKIGSDTWTTIARATLGHEVKESDNAAFKFVTTGRGVEFVTANEPVDLRFDVQITELPSEGYTSTDEIRFGLQMDTDTSDIEYETLSFSYEKVPRLKWNPITAVEEVL